MNNNIQMIAIDIDGTLLDDNYRWDHETRDLLLELQRSDISIMLCTGRALSATMNIAKEMGMESFLVTDNGAIVHHLPTNTNLAVKQLAIQDHPELLGILDQTGAHLDLTSIQGMYAKPHNQEIASMYKKYLVNPEIVTDMTTVREPIVKATLFAPPDQISSIMNDLPAQLSHIPVQCFQSGPTFIDIMHKETSKGNALQYLSNYLEIPVQGIMAIGNYYNDLDMIRYAGIGVAMENAPEDIKKEAVYTTASNNDQGVKKAIEHFLKK